MINKNIEKFICDPFTEELQKINQLINNSLQYAQELGATQCETSSSISSGINATIRMSKIDTLEFNQDQGFAVTVYFDKHQGNASTTDISWPSIKTNFHLFLGQIPEKAENSPKAALKIPRAAF